MKVVSDQMNRIRRFGRLIGRYVKSSMTWILCSSTLPTRCFFINVYVTLYWQFIKTWFFTIYGSFILWLEGERVKKNVLMCLQNRWNIYSSSRRAGRSHGYPLMKKETRNTNTSSNGVKEDLKSILAPRLSGSKGTSLWPWRLFRYCLYFINVYQQEIYIEIFIKNQWLPMKEDSIYSQILKLSIFMKLLELLRGVD